MARDGFIIPNASTYAPDYQTSQPDQGDFLILGNSQYGVIAGCKVSLSGFGIVLSASPNLAVVAGDVYSLTGVPLSLSGPSAKARFDLVVFDSVDGLSIVTGVAADNPVFPDITATMVVLAAVFVPASAGSEDLRLIDKRNFLQTTLASVNATTVLRNYASGGATVKVNIDGNGKISWNGDTHLERKTGSPGVVKITDDLETRNITATGAVTVAGNGVITTETIDWGTTAARPLTADIGDIYVDNQTGSISVWKIDADSVQKWVTVQPNVPAGTIIMSMAPEGSMAGWLPLSGGSYPVGNAGNLPVLFPSWVSGGDIILPDFRGRFPLGAGAGVTPGPINTQTGNVVDSKGSTLVTLTTDNLPAHSHRSGSTTSTAGTHTHSGGSTGSSGAHTHTVTSGGSHTHTLNDPGHGHTWQAGFPMVATFPGADHDSCMDNPFVDSSHNYRTIASEWSNNAYTYISANPAGSHNHSVNSAGSHTHTFPEIPSAGSHSHDIPEHLSVGGGQAVTIRPPSISVNFYIKI